MAQSRCILIGGTTRPVCLGQVSAVLCFVASYADPTSLLYELEMLYSFSFLLLWEPFLLNMLRKASSDDDSQLSQADIRVAIECAQLVNSVRARSEEISQHRGFERTSWLGTYTLFLSEVYAMVLSSLGNMPVQVRSRVRPTLEGFRTLAASKCGNACAAAALDVLKVRCLRLPRSSLILSTRL